jgi:hypothetical protein
MLRRLALYTYPSRTLSHTLTRSMSLFTTNRLEGKTVLVTGASGGIGAATAILFSSVQSSLSLHPDFVLTSLLCFAGAQKSWV